MNRFLPRVVFLAIALIITLGILELWAQLSGAIGHFFSEPPRQIPKPTGDVTMTIITPGNPPAQPPKKSCTKQHPCP
jgi:hypothetical protein